MNHLLINPNQVRHYVIKFWENQYDNERELIIELDNTIYVILWTKGTKVLFDTWSPSDAELRDFPQLQITSSNEWKSTTVSLNEMTTGIRFDRTIVIKFKRATFSKSTQVLRRSDTI